MTERAGSLSLGTLAFDAYGTLFDVHSVIAACEAAFPSHGEALSRLWRAKQLEYTWLLSLMDRYEDFWAVTEKALRYACQQLGLPATSHPNAPAGELLPPGGVSRGAGRARSPGGQSHAGDPLQRDTADARGGNAGHGADRGLRRAYQRRGGACLQAQSARVRPAAATTRGAAGGDWLRLVQRLRHHRGESVRPPDVLGQPSRRHAGRLGLPPDVEVRTLAELADRLTAERA